MSLETGCLDNLTSLEELLLAKNRLSSFPKGIFSVMKNLQVSCLVLINNKIVWPIIKYFIIVMIRTPDLSGIQNDKQ